MGWVGGVYVLSMLCGPWVVWVWGSWEMGRVAYEASPVNDAISSVVYKGVMLNTGNV